MALSTDLISQFVKVTKDETKDNKGSTVYGEVVKHNGKDYVKIDGSDLLTPISSSSIVVDDGERVATLIKDHTATVTGNITSPAGTDKSVQNVSQKVTELYSVVAEKATFEQLEAEKARIDDLVADNVTIKEQLTADSADIRDLKAKDVTIEGKLTAAEANIENLNTKKLDASVADIKYATIDNLNATNADVHNLNADYGEFKKATAEDLTAKQATIEKLKTDKLDASEAEIKYATIENLNAESAKIGSLQADYGEFKKATVEDLTTQNADIEKLKTDKLDAANAAITYATIDFANINEAAVQKLFSDSGIIKDLVVSEGKITGELVGVTIKGDLIEGGTVVADKLVVKGENGLYYKLNTDGVTTEAEQTDYNSLNGQVIAAKSITATKISVDDLVAFGATIGGFNITDSAIYSGAKGGVDSGIQGVYLDKTGQMAIGDGNNYLKYYKDQNGVYKLEISASSVKFGSSSKNLENVVSDIQDKANTAEQNSSNALNKANSASDKVDDLQQRADSGEFKGDKGDTGATGNGVKSSEVTYQASTSGTTIPTGTWSTSIPSVAAGSYLWTKTVLTYTNGSTTTSYSVGKMGNTGAKGDKGETGTAGKGIKSTAITYQAWPNGTSTPTGTWSSSPPATSASNPYLWTRTIITYTDNSTSTSYSVGSTPEGIVIGGRNLFLQTKTFSAPWVCFGSSAALTVDTDGFWYSRLRNTWTNYIYQTLVLESTTYTISFYAKADSDVYLEIKDDSANNVFLNGTVINTTDWSKYSVLIKPTKLQSTPRIAFLTRQDASDIYIKKIKLEKGNKATDWTPAPEDVENYTDNAVSDAKTEITREYSSLINETASQISLTVDELSRTVNANSDSIVHINNSINVTSQDINLVKTTMSNIQNAVNGKVSSDEIKEWARFDGATLELGASNQPFKARLTTTELAFYQGSNKVAWISNNELHILTAIITQSIGCGNFTFVDEGSMGFSLL